MVFATSLVLIAVAVVMFWGWGSAFQKLFRLNPESWPATVTLGMAAVVFVGGILNLARIAYPMALVAVAIAGIAFALRAGAAFERPSLIVATVIAAVIIFTIATQLPPGIYNFHDDYQKYFAYPVRMLETGTVYGSPLSAMGLQTLGAQAFLDGFVVGFFPIQYINGVDAVFGFFLCLILAAQFTKDRAMMVICVLSVVFINPQYVNVSTLFCGSALIMAMVAIDDPASLGLLYAALIALKPIYAVFIVVHLLVMMPVLGGIRRVVRTGLAAAVFLAPWVLVHAPNYLAILSTHHPAPTPVAGRIDTERIHLFSFEPLAYGASAANYTLLVIAFAVCGLICWKVKPAILKPIACCLAAVVTFVVFVYVLAPMQYGYDHGLRYYTPIAIGLAPPIFGWTALAASRTRPPAMRAWLPLMVATIPLAAFGPSLCSRIVAAVNTHSVASFSWLTKDPDYVAYNQTVLSGAERDMVKALQEEVPPGEPILVWINTPFYLNYKRNRIIDIDTAGIGLPWSRLPSAQYLIWDYDGFATADHYEYERRTLNTGAGERKDSMMTLDFIRKLNGMVEKGEILFDDGEIKVVRLVGPPFVAAAALSGGRARPSELFRHRYQPR